MKRHAAFHMASIAVIFAFLLACSNDLPSNSLSAEMISRQSYCADQGLGWEVSGDGINCIFADGSFCDSDLLEKGACSHIDKLYLQTLEVGLDDSLSVDSVEIRIGYDINLVSPIFLSGTYAGREILFSSPLDSKRSGATADRKEILIAFQNLDKMEISGTIARLPVKLSQSASIERFRITSASAWYEGQEILLDAGLSLV